jgi:hypothetical protein
MILQVRNLRRKALFASITVAAIGLAACGGGPSISCTVTYNPTANKGTGTTKAASLGSADVASIDAATLSATISSSGPIVSDPGVYTVTVRNAGSIVASTQASYIRTGNTFTAADPAALNSWIRSYAGAIDEVDVVVDNIVVSQMDGTNSMTLSSNYGGGTYASATTTWQGLLHHTY